MIPRVMCAGIAIAVAVAIFAAVKSYPEDYDAAGKLLVDGAKMAVEKNQIRIIRLFAPKAAAYFTSFVILITIAKPKSSTVPFSSISFL